MTHRLYLLIILFFAIEVFGQPVTGVNTFWNGTIDSDLTNAENWNNGVPDTSTFTIATVSYLPTRPNQNPELNVPFAIGELRAGRDGTSINAVTITLNSGSALTASQIKLGHSLTVDSSDSNANLIINGGTHSTSGQFHVGVLTGIENSNSVFGSTIMNGGSLNINGDHTKSGNNGLFVGHIYATNIGNSTGTFTMNGGILSVGGNSCIGNHPGYGTAIGIFTMNGGTAIFNSLAPVGNGTSTLNLNGGALVVSSISERTGDLTINMNGGIFIIDNSSASGTPSARTAIFKRFTEGLSVEGGNVTIQVTGGYKEGSTAEVAVANEYTSGLTEINFGDHTLKYAHNATGKTAMWSTTTLPFVETAADPIAGGTVTGTGIYNYEELATFEATASTGYVFSSWSTGDIENPLTFAINSSLTITANFSQDTSDADGDGLSAYQESLIGTNPDNPDTDFDGLSDLIETGTAEYIDSSDTGTDPNDSDTDNDGFLDGSETNTKIYVSATDTGTHPLFADSDADGYSDYVETNTGTWISANDTGTDPNRADTDKDGIVDGRETNTGIYVSVADTGTNPFETDSDGDGFSDKYEVEVSNDPNNSDDSPDARGFIETAVEYKFHAASGGIYRIEHSENIDSATWVIVEDGIVGEGKLIERLYSTEDYSRRFFRAIRTD